MRHRERRRMVYWYLWLRISWWSAYPSLMVVHANVAYPGLWTGRQPNGQTTGTEQVLIGTPEYHFAVVETDTTFYPTVRGADGTIYYSSMGHDGRFLPTNVQVGSIDPDNEESLRDALDENEHVVHAQCVEQDFCKWHYQQKLLRSKPQITSGSIANLVIPFQFSNHEGVHEKMSTDDLDQILFNGPELSVKDYFSQQSYGKLQVISELTPWVTIPYTEKQCADQRSGLTISMHTCLEAALEQASKLLADWDTIVSSVTTLTFVHSGYAAEFGGNDPEGTWYEDRIWSHAWELETPHYTGGYAIISDKYDRKNAHLNRVGVAVHELAQVLGAPSIYGDYPGYGLGYYDMLANPWGFDGTLTHCGSMSPYTRNLFGWIELEEIDQDGSYDLTHSFESSKVYVIRRGFPEGEYLILENRQEEGYDKGLSQPGIAIFHIDEKANDVGGHPGTRNFPKDHYIAALLQGDGRFDLERMEDEGDSGDLFHSGRFSGLGPDGVFLADGSLQSGGYPNTNSYRGGEVKSTGIVITDISAPDKVMSFKVSFT
jgi:M6 family metalloprotease-like protein